MVSISTLRSCVTWAVEPLTVESPHSTFTLRAEILIRDAAKIDRKGFQVFRQFRVAIHEVLQAVAKFGNHPLVAMLGDEILQETGMFRVRH